MGLNSACKGLKVKEDMCCSLREVTIANKPKNRI
jgi:hypothetical protein